MGFEKYAEKGYKAVFGQDHHQQIKCLILEAWESTAIEERLRVTNNSRLKEVTMDYFSLLERFGYRWHLR